MSVLGTAREAYENSIYNKLIDKYGEPTAEKLIEPQLKEHNLSLSEFKIYRKVKKVVQNDGLNIKQARNEAEEFAFHAVCEVFA